MYPLLLKAPLKDYLWGGRRLIEEFGFKTEKEKAAEAWMLSCHKDGNSVVRNGELAGLSLQQAIEIWGAEALGCKAADFTYFPILIKLIDAKDRLSVQVHPNDEYALANEGEYGKTEMWYVVDCDEGAQLIYGFNQDISQGEFLERINNNNLSPVCNYVPVKKGDVFFIEAGTMHAIGKGILIAEIQQNSNTTYRVSDYGRLGADGRPRELHIQKAVDVTLTDKPTVPYGDVGETNNYEYGTERQLAACEYFKTAKLDLEGEREINTENGFVSLLVLSGEINVKYDSGVVKAQKGGSIFIPQGLKVLLSGRAEVIYSKEN